MTNTQASTVKEHKKKRRLNLATCPKTKTDKTPKDKGRIGPIGPRKKKSPKEKSNDGPEQGQIFYSATQQGREKLRVGSKRAPQEGSAILSNESPKPQGGAGVRSSHRSRIADTSHQRPGTTSAEHTKQGRVTPGGAEPRVSTPNSVEQPGDQFRSAQKLTST